MSILKVDSLFFFFLFFFLFFLFCGFSFRPFFVFFALFAFQTILAPVWLLTLSTTTQYSCYNMSIFRTCII